MVLKKTVLFLLLFAVSVAEINGKNEVTKKDIKKYKKEYKEYVYEQQGNIIYTPEKFIVWGARYYMKLNEFSISLILVSYKFFKEESQLKKTLDEVCVGDEKDLEYINDVIGEYDKQGKDDKDLLIRISHKKHVNSLTLSEKINKESLFNNPKLFKRFVDQEKINPEQYRHAVALNLLIQFIVDNRN